MFWRPIGPQRRFTFGVRGELDYVHPFGSTNSENLPIFERLFTGGEYSVRGYDIRSIGPRDVGTPEHPGTFIVLGGNKLALFNTEFHYAIAGPFRVLAYFDAGQVQDFGQKFRMDDFVMSTGAEVRFFMPVLNVPVPPDLRAQHESGWRSTTTTCSPSRRIRSGSPWGRRSGANGRRMDGLEAILRGSLYLRSRGLPV